MNNKELGNLIKTPKEHREFGSTSFRFDYLVTGPIQQDIAIGEQMTTDALQVYYDKMLKQTQDVSSRLSSLPRQAALPFTLIIGNFEIDLDYLEKKGIDVSIARTELESLNPRLQALLPEE